MVIPYIGIDKALPVTFPDPYFYCYCMNNYRSVSFIASNFPGRSDRRRGDGGWGSQQMVNPYPNHFFMHHYHVIPDIRSTEPGLIILMILRSFPTMTTTPTALIFPITFAPPLAFSEASSII